MSERTETIVKLIESGLTYKEVATKLNTTVLNVGSTYKNYQERMKRIEKSNQILAESEFYNSLVIYKGKFRYSTEYHTDFRDVGYLRVDEQGYISLYHFSKNNLNKLSKCHHRYPIGDYELASTSLSEYVNEQLTKVVDRMTDLESKIAKTEKLLEKYKAELQALREEEENE